MQELIDLMMPEIRKLSSWISMPREDAVQAILVEFIAFLKRGEHDDSNRRDGGTE